jgi:hypothetical protein
MTAAVPAAFLDLTSASGVVQRRWQSRWVGATVTHEGQAWDYQRFDCDAIPSGAVSDAAQAGLSFTMLPTVLATLEEGQAAGWRGRLRIYHYPAADDGPAPPASMVLVASPRGLLSIESITLNAIRVVLASTQLAGGSGQFPPRRADQALIGIPCELET